MTTCSSAAYGTRHRRGGAAPDCAPSPAIRIRAVVPAPRSHVAKRSIFVARGPGGLLPFATNSSLTRRQHPRAHSRTHPQHARTRRHRERIVVAFFSLSCTDPRVAPTTCLASRGTPGVFPFLLQGSHPFLGRPFFLSLCFALRRLLFLSACVRVAPRATPTRKQKPAR